jgi:2-polyprenyl-3-methyl-5-hydroxy-6-metoxy-1,4-benzoquinol methylase
MNVSSPPCWRTPTQVRRNSLQRALPNTMSARDYGYSSAEAPWEDGYLAQKLIRRLQANDEIRRVLDAGCGNGNLTARLAAQGFQMCGFDASNSGVEHARQAFPGIRFEVASAYEDLRARFRDPFDACIAVEVIEHLYDPRTFVRRLFDVIRPGGWMILTTPYHGYLKNLSLAATGKMDAHYTALWDGGHIKFWSRATLTRLVEESGLHVFHFEGAGRIPLLWKSMILTARRPS